MEGAVEAVCLVAVEALLVVLAWKLRRGQWLNLIAGNTFADEEERRRPYQRQMGRDVANVLVLCAAGLPAVIALGRFSDRGTIGPQADLVAFAALMAVVIAACARLSVRAGRAEREEDRAMGLPESPKAGESLGRAQVIAVCVLIAAVLAISLLPVLLMP